MANPFENMPVFADNQQTNLGIWNASPFQTMSMFPEGRPSVAGLDLNSSDFLTRESLGVLSNSFLLRDSLTRDELNKQTTKQFDLSDISPRESLGILNLSALDLGRESLQIFNIRESLVVQKPPIGLLEVKKTLVNKSPIKITVSDIEDNNSGNSASVEILNQALLYSYSRKLSSTSSTLSHCPNFSFRSLNEPSPILPLNSFEYQIDSKLTLSDPLNEAFKHSGNLENKCSVSQMITSETTAQPDLNQMQDLKKRTQSLPFSLEENIICKDEKDNFYDSVFLESKKVLGEMSCYIEDKSSDSSKYLLDSITEPNWPVVDLESPQNDSEAKIKDTAAIQKKIDRLIDLNPVYLNDQLKQDIVIDNSNEESDLVIKRNPKLLLQEISPGNRSVLSSNASGNISKISQSSNDSILKIIKNLSDFVKEKDGLSTSRKNEYLHSLNSLASELSGSKSEPLSEDSGHSSVGDQQQSESPENMNGTDTNNQLSAVSGECHALDLSCKSKTFACDDEKKISISRSSFSPATTRKPPPYVPKAPKRNSLKPLSTSASSHDGSKKSFQESQSKSGSMSNRSSSGVSQTRVVIAGKLRKSKVAPVANKKGPLRAVLPLENMAKGNKAVTPERNENTKNTLRSNRTSTPIQEISLKPTVTSTPANLNSSGKDCAISPLSTKPKYYRSFSEKLSIPSTSTRKLDKSRETTPTMPKAVLKSIKVDTSKIRRNSVSEVIDIQNDKTEGVPRLKRSFSTGKEPKMMSALKKVRENILNSPFYKPKSDGNSNQGAQTNVLTENNRRSSTGIKGPGNKLNMISTSRKVGKENVKN